VQLEVELFVSFRDRREVELMMNRKKLISETEQFVRERMREFGPSHDWNHVERVRSLALAIAEEEGADPLTVELAALLHDVDDYKFSGTDQTGSQSAEEWLTAQNVNTKLVTDIMTIIEGVTFQGGGEEDVELGPEGRCVRDADRLEAMGALGIARAFSYGGHKSQTFHDPNILPAVVQDAAAYKAGGSGTTINHFYEKPLLLKERMGTAAGRHIAEGRHRVIEGFLEQFEKEWNGGDWRSTIHPAP
jgi:uncharacterized protein